MEKTRAATVDEYLAGLSPDRRDVVSAVRNVIRRNLPSGYDESAAYGMIGYSVPLERYPVTHNGQPLCYAGLAAQKHHYALYLMAPYASPRLAQWLRDEFDRTGKKLDMGKSCVRFRSLDDLPLDVIAQIIAKVPAEEFIAQYERSRHAAAKPKASRAKKAPSRAKKASPRPKKKPSRTKRTSAVARKSSA